MLDWLREQLPAAILGAVVSELLHLTLKLLAKLGSLRRKTPEWPGKHFKRS